MNLIFQLLLVLGVGIGLARVALRAPARQALWLVDQGLLVLLAALVGGRVGYVALNWDYFNLQRAEIVQVWLGGISGLGAAHGFVIGLCLSGLRPGARLGYLADSLAPLGLSLAVSAWLAAWWTGSAYGPFLEAGVGLPARDESGAWAVRFPTQLVGALLTLGLWAGLDMLENKIKPARLTPGALAAVGLLGFSFLMVGLSFLRVDPLPVWRGLRVDAWASLGLVAWELLGLAAVMLTRRRRS